MRINQERNPWELYTRLIDGIPTGVKVRNWGLGRRWSYVESELGCGIAMSVSGGRSLGRKGASWVAPTTADESFELRESTQKVLSWSFEEASVGVAA